MGNGRGAASAERVFMGSHAASPKDDDVALGDAQAIFDELELQLAPIDNGDTAAAPAATSQLSEHPASGSSSSSMPPVPRLSKLEDPSMDIGTRGDAPHLLSFYRA